MKWGSLAGEAELLLSLANKDSDDVEKRGKSACHYRKWVFYEPFGK